MNLSTIILDAEFRPLEDLLSNDACGYLDFLRVLKFCWEQVSQKSKTKDSTPFREECLAILKKFLCEQYHGECVGFYGEILLKNLYGNHKGSEKLFAERCACHYATLRSLLRSAHYGEKMGVEKYKEWAYYDFTLLFCPFMNLAAKNISTGNYLKKLPNIQKDVIVDLWELKNAYWNDTEYMLHGNYWDESRLHQLRELFFATILAPCDILFSSIVDNKKRSQFLTDVLPKRVGAQRWRFHWKRLYSGAYDNLDNIRRITKNGRNPNLYVENAAPVRFMDSIFWRMTSQMNTANFSIFSLTANPWIDLYKYCLVQRGTSKDFYNLRVSGEKVRNFMLFPAGDTLKENFNQMKSPPIVRTLNMVYAPVNAVWRAGEVQNAVSFYHFITEWVIKNQRSAEGETSPGFEELLQDFEFSVEPCSEGFRKNKDLLVRLKNFLSAQGLISRGNGFEINWQNMLAAGLEPLLERNEKKTDYHISRIIGDDEEIVSSGICFREDKIVRIRTEADVPKEFDPETNYVVDFTRDDFISFLLDVALNQNKLDGKSPAVEIKERMTTNCKCFPSAYGDLKQMIYVEFQDEKDHLGNRGGSVISFPIVINRRSQKDDWTLTDRDEIKVQEAVKEFLVERWNKIAEQAQAPKKFDFIHLVLHEGMQNSGGVSRKPSGRIYHIKNSDPEIALLKTLIFR